MKTLTRISMYIVIATLVLWIVPWIFLVEIGPHEIGVRHSSLSGVLEEDLGPGWHWRVPGIHSVTILPSSYLFLDYSSDDDARGSLMIRTKDNNEVFIDVSVPIRIRSGGAHAMVSDGTHHRDVKDDRYRYQHLAEETTVSVLREQLAELDSVGFYTTGSRLAVAEKTLEVLNEKLEPLHLEAASVLIRAVKFRDAYESQLQRIQLNEQNKLLDQARQNVADKQQQLDNYQQGTNALAASLEQDWVTRMANLERAYQVGFIDVEGDAAPGAARRKMESLSDEDRLALVTQAAEVFALESPEAVKPEYLLGIKNIEAETREYEQRVGTEARAVAARLHAEGAARLAKVRGEFESRLNALLSSPAGRAYVAWKSADNISFDKNLTFNSSDGIPSVLRLREFAQQFMGGR